MRVCVCVCMCKCVCFASLACSEAVTRDAAVLLLLCGCADVQVQDGNRWGESKHTLKKKVGTVRRQVVFGSR